MFWLNQFCLHKHCRKMSQRCIKISGFDDTDHLENVLTLSKKHNLITAGKCPVVLTEMSSFVATNDLEIEMKLPEILVSVEPTNFSHLRAPFVSPSYNIQVKFLFIYHSVG